MKRLLLLFAAAALCFAVSADARVPIGTLAGTVYDSHGQPVSEAAVTIQSSDGSEPFATHTDPLGQFRIIRLETGQYDIRASAAGLLSQWDKRVMVQPNKTTIVSLHLPQQKA